MRWYSLLVAILGLALSASQASAQCYWIAPPNAPDMRGPGFYYMNCYGVIYGPNYYVRPPFPPYQGALLGPRVAACAGPGYHEKMGQYFKTIDGFPRHVFARSPRDFFMNDVQPPASPYNYGNVGGAYGRGGDACND